MNLLVVIKLILRRACKLTPKKIHELFHHDRLMWTSWGRRIGTRDFFAFHWRNLDDPKVFGGYFFPSSIEINRCIHMYWFFSKKNRYIKDYHSPSKNSPPKKIISPGFRGLETIVPFIRGGILGINSSWIATLAASYWFMNKKTNCSETDH